jgi:hypothetical protein
MSPDDSLIPLRQEQLNFTHSKRVNGHIISMYLSCSYKFVLRAGGSSYSGIGIGNVVALEYFTDRLVFCFVLFVHTSAGASAGSPVVVQQYPGNSKSLCVCRAI